MRRRDAIRAGGSAVVVALAGCTSGSGDDDAGSGFDDVSSPWSREGEVYHPSHSIGMRMLDMVQSGSLTVGLASKYTERFWTVTGERTKRVGVEDEYNAIHLMVSVWDTETGTVLPVDTGLRVAVERDGERLTERAMWPMLSQRMGFHFGDNIQFPDQGSYTLVVDVGDTSVERIGDGDFDGSETLRLGYEFDRTTRNLVPVEKLLDRRGDADALQPMQMERWPLSVAPARSGLPGTVLGSGRSDGAVFDDRDDRWTGRDGLTTDAVQSVRPAADVAVAVGRTPGNNRLRRPALDGDRPRAWLSLPDDARRTRVGRRADRECRFTATGRPPRRVRDGVSRDVRRDRHRLTVSPVTGRPRVRGRAGTRRRRPWAR